MALGCLWSFQNLWLRWCIWMWFGDCSLKTPCQPNSGIQWLYTNEMQKRTASLTFLCVFIALCSSLHAQWFKPNNLSYASRCCCFLCFQDMQTTTVKNSDFWCKYPWFEWLWLFTTCACQKKERKKRNWKRVLRKAAQLQSGYDANCVQSSHNLILFISGWP